MSFTDEEGYGKYLDLNELYHKYVNLKGVEKINYIKYLSEFDHLFNIPREKKNQDYKSYVEEMYNYLYNYIERIKPLFDINSELNAGVEEFEQKWTEGSFPGWPVCSIYFLYYLLFKFLIHALIDFYRKKLQAR